MAAVALFVPEVWLSVPGVMGPIGAAVLGDVPAAPLVCVGIVPLATPLVASLEDPPFVPPALLTAPVAALDVVFAAPVASDWAMAGTHQSAAAQRRPAINAL